MIYDMAWKVKNDIPNGKIRCSDECERSILKSEEKEERSRST